MDIKKLKLGMYLFYYRYVKGMLFILNWVCIGYVLFSNGYVKIIGHPEICNNKNLLKGIGTFNPTRQVRLIRHSYTPKQIPNIACIIKVFLSGN